MVGQDGGWVGSASLLGGVRQSRDTGAVRAGPGLGDLR
jgi:hypothetical protein